MVPRFGVTQGQKPDGSTKVRAVDNFSWSLTERGKKRKRQDQKAGSVNGNFQPDVVMKHDHLDDLLASMRLHKEWTSTARGPCSRAIFCFYTWLAFDKAPALMKADIDSAYRRVPIKQTHRWAASVAWKCRGQTWTATHIGMPFGATASGIAWHKVGDLLALIGRRLLGLPLLRYVDDYFAVDR